MVSVPNANSLTIREKGTISFWVYPYTLNTENGYVHKGDDKDFDDACYSFCNESGTRKLKLIIYKKFLWWIIPRTMKSNTAATLNTWSYMAASWDKSSLFATLFGGGQGHLDLYINGNVNQVGWSILSAQKTNSHLNIGAKTREYKNSSLGNYGFDGMMDEVRIFFRKLETSELTILQNYDPTTAAGSVDSYKIVYWDN